MELSQAGTVASHHSLEFLQVEPASDWVVTELFSPLQNGGRGVFEE